MYSAITKGAAEFSTVTKLEVTDAGPGFAEVVAVAAEGFPRGIEHCSWTCGLLTCPPALLGLAPGVVEHEECQAMGAPRCVYRVSWDRSPGGGDGDTSAQMTALRHQLETTKERLRSVFANASDLIAVDDLDGVLARMTARAALEGIDTEAEGWTPTPGGPLDRLLQDPRQEFLFVDETTGDPILRRILTSRGFVATVLVPLVTTDSFLGLLSVLVFDRPCRMKLTPEMRDRLSGAAAQAVTALQNGRLVDEITHQAMHDQLTGLANRAQFTGRLLAAVERARQTMQAVTLLYIDLDGFKPVNDEFGHDVGDQLLAAVAKRLSACTRGEDVVARLGGDEFAVLVDSRTRPRDAEVVSERLAVTLTDPFTIEGHHLQVGASIGRAVFPIDADDADSLLRAADAAMFRVRRGSRSGAMSTP